MMLLWIRIIILKIDKNPINNQNNISIYINNLTIIGIIQTIIINLILYKISYTITYIIQAY